MYKRQILGDYFIIASADNTTHVRALDVYKRQDVEHASHLVKEAGLSLGLQMMVGLPGDTKPSDAWFTAKRLLALTPDTMRIYPAVILPHTKLAVWYQSCLLYTSPATPVYFVVWQCAFS